MYLSGFFRGTTNRRFYTFGEKKKWKNKPFGKINEFLKNKQEISTFVIILVSMGLSNFPISLRAIKNLPCRMDLG